MGLATYIECTGANYIDTGFIPNGNSKIIIDCVLNSSATSNQPIFGARQSVNSSSFTLWGISSSTLRFDYGTSKNSSSAYTPKDRHIYTMSSSDGCLVDGTSVKTLSNTSFNAPCNLVLSAVNTAGSITYGKYRIYSCKIYDNGTLVRDYVPWKDTSGVYCLHDKVNDTYTYSATSTSLSGSDSLEVDITKTSDFEIETGLVINCPYSGSMRSLKLPKGKYKLEVWGAQGGSYSSYYGGYGGYSTGVLTLAQKTIMYVYVGGAGSSSSTTGGFNGGGDGVNSGRGGGGASDFRINSNSLYSRVIVAGAGGGAGITSASANPAGCGGGQYGGDGYYNNTTGSYTVGNNRSGGSASQTDGGISWSSIASTKGSFGQGGNAYNYSCGGGGSGWYGGGGAYDNDSDGDGRWGGGGSGYVYTASTASNYPSGCLLTSSYYLTDAQTIAGNTSFTSPSGSSETGHAGNGYCRITVIECQNTQINIRINNSIKKASSFYAKIGGNWKKLANSFSNLSVGEVLNFPYSGSVQTITLPAGQYKLECWGAQGGYRSSSSYGGKGGYSVGTITLEKETILYIYAGGAGNTVTTASSSIYPGGFNGGGYRYGYKGGGGASDFRIGTDSLYSRVIVAGGGGSDGSSSCAGGAGGGTSGVNGSGGYYSTYKGTGGTQTGNSAGHTCNTSQGTTNSSSNCPGGFGFGGFGAYTSSGYGGSGGGGWYGGEGTYPDGSGDDDYGGGGGSGYIYTSSTASNYPSGCLLNSSHYLTGAQTINGATAFTSPSGASETGHTGDGYCRITVLSIEVSKKILLYVKNNSWKQITI